MYTYQLQLIELLTTLILITAVTAWIILLSSYKISWSKCCYQSHLTQTKSACIVTMYITAFICYAWRDASVCEKSSKLFQWKMPTEVSNVERYKFIPGKQSFFSASFDVPNWVVAGRLSVTIITSVKLISSVFSLLWLHCTYCM